MTGGKTNEHQEDHAALEVFSQEGLGLPDFLITGTGVEIWGQDPGGRKRPGKGVQRQEERRHQFQGGGLN